MMITCKLKNPDNWKTANVTVSLTDITKKYSIDCMSNNNNNCELSSAGAPDGLEVKLIEVKLTEYNSFNIYPKFIGKTNTAYICTATINGTQDSEMIYAELVETGVYFTDASRDGSNEALLTHNVSKIVCGAYNNIAYSIKSINIYIGNASKHKCVSGDEPVTSCSWTVNIGKVNRTRDIVVKCEFIFNTGSETSTIMSTKNATLYPNCPAGNVLKDGTCKSCEDGYRSKSDSQYEGCLSCNISSGPNKAKTGCSACNNAKNEISRSGRSCMTCPAGTSVPAGTSAVNNTCGQCDAGYSAAFEHNCTSCREGHYASGKGSPLCTACSPGSYQDKKGQTSCKKCPAGKYQDESGAKNCTPCSTGQYQTKQGQTWCLTIQPGYEVVDKGESQVAQKCKTGTYSTGGSKCIECDEKNKEYTTTSGATYCSVCATDLVDKSCGGSAVKCLNETISSNVINVSGVEYTFAETVVGDQAKVPCTSKVGEAEYITRKCRKRGSKSARWATPNYEQCTSKFGKQIQAAMKFNFTSQMALAAGTSDMNNLLRNVADMLPSDITLVAKGLTNIKDTQLNQEIITNVANTVNLLTTNTAALNFVASSDKVNMLATIDMLAKNTAKEIRLATIAMKVMTSDDAVPIPTNMSTHHAPKLIMDKLMQVSIATYDQTAKGLFPTPEGEVSNKGVSTVNSSVESAIVAMTLSNGTFKPFELHLYSDSSKDTDIHGKSKKFVRTCQYLNTSTNTWHTGGCETKKLNNDKYQCTCDHNTSFAILLSVSGIKDTSQDTASTVMGVFNLIFLILTFCALAPFKKFRERQLMQIQINLVFALILANLGFIILSATTTVNVNALGEPRMSLNKACVAGTIIVQYLFLAVMAWMTCAAFTLYAKIVDAIKTYGKQDRFYLLKCSLGCWVFPIILPVTAALTAYAMNDSKDEFSAPYVGANAEMENGTSCWVDAPWKWISFFLPCWACLIINFVLIVMIGRVIIRSARMGSNATDHSREIKALMTIAFTVGIPWVFAALTFGAVAQLFQWLFIIITGLQGLGMFICFVVFQEDVLTNMFSLFGQTPPDFLLAGKARSAKEIASMAKARPKTSVTKVDEESEHEDQEEKIEFPKKEENIYSNKDANEDEAIYENNNGDEGDGKPHVPQLV